MSLFKVFISGLLLISICSPSYAEAAEEHSDFRFRFGGWSKHFSKDEFVFREYELNETHHGIGFQYWLDTDGSNWDVGVDVFTMRDSHHQRANMFSVAGRYPFALDNDLLNEISIQAGITYHDRSYLSTHNLITTLDGEIVDTKITHTIRRNNVFTPMLTTTFTFKDKLDVDFIFLPKNNYTRAGVAFIRLGWNW